MAVVTQDNWSARTRYIADLVGADAIVVTVAGGASGYSTYASHNIDAQFEKWDVGAITRAMRDQTVSVMGVSMPLADERIASDLCVAPLTWHGRVIGSLSGLRVGRSWEPAARSTLARSADLIALELAETHSRLWWQRTAEAWQHRLQLLEQSRRALSNATDAASIVEAAAKHVAELCGTSGASLMLFDDEGQLVVRSAFGPHEERARSARRQLGEGISGWVAQHGEPLLLRGRVEDPRFSGVDPSIDESLIVPLRFGGRVVGVIATRTSRSHDQLGPERLKDLDLVGGELALLVAHAEEAAARIDITTRLENDRREAVAMYDLARLAGIGAEPDGDLEGAAQLISQAFGHDSVAIWTVDAAKRKLTCRTAQGYGEVVPGDLPLGGNDLIGSVLAEQRARLVNDAASGSWRSFRATSVILAPIVAGGESVGLLVLGRRGGRYQHFDFSLAVTMADILSSLVRRELAAQLSEYATIERRQIIERMQGEFAEEMGRVVYVLDAVQRLLGRDRDLPNDLARAARDARSALDRLGIPMGRVGEAAELAVTDAAPRMTALDDGSPSTSSSE